MWPQFDCLIWLMFKFKILQNQKLDPEDFRPLSLRASGPPSFGPSPGSDSFPSSEHSVIEVPLWSISTSSTLLCGVDLLGTTGPLTTVGSSTWTGLQDDLAFSTIRRSRQSGLLDDPAFSTIRPSRRSSRLGDPAFSAVRPSRRSGLLGNPAFSAIRPSWRSGLLGARKISFRISFGIFFAVSVFFGACWPIRNYQLFNTTTTAYYHLHFLGCPGFPGAGLFLESEELLFNNQDVLVGVFTSKVIFLLSSLLVVKTRSTRLSLDG